jgi:hypothetical protein
VRCIMNSSQLLCRPWMWPLKTTMVETQEMRSWHSLTPCRFRLARHCHIILSVQVR